MVIKVYDKQCPGCSEIKPSNCFTKNIRTSSGLQAYCRECHRVRSKKSRERHAVAHEDTRLQRTYGITLANYDSLLAAQGGVCAICATQSDKKLVVDHCHTSGKVRGLLCNHCNLMLGYSRDDKTILANAEAYLSRAEAEG